MGHEHVRAGACKGLMWALCMRMQVQAETRQRQCLCEHRCLWRAEERSRQMTAESMDGECKCMWVQAESRGVHWA